MKLKYKHSFFITGEIDPDTYRNLVKFLHLQKKADQINIIICSEGGCPHTAWEIIDYLQLFEVEYSVPVHMFAYGQVMSAAFDIYVSGSNRHTSPSTLFMSHCSKGESASTSLNTTVGRFFDKKQFEVMRKACKKRYGSKKLRELFVNDVDQYYLPSQLIKHGMTEEIVTLDFI